MPVSPALALRGLVLAYGAGTLAAQVIILREVLVLCQGQELKLALGLWCWLFWTGVGSLAGGRLASRWPPDLQSLGVFLALLGWLLPATVLGARLLPALAPIPWGQSLPPVTALILFLLLLAPFGLTSGCFFPFACEAQRILAPPGAIGRIYALEALGAALGVGLLQIVLLGQYANLALSLGTGLFLQVFGILLARRLGFSLGALILAGALFFSPQLEIHSRAWQWPGREVVATVDSPYALITATREKEQLSFFANNVWHFTHPDPYSAEHAVHLALLQHPHPERVLLLGGGVAGLVPEILKHKSINQLHYVELDPELVRLAERLVQTATGGPSGDSRVRIFYQDARRFLTQTKNRYDVIILGLPEPTNAQLNRYYSREFFHTAAQHLKSGGVFSFSLGSGGISLNPLRAAYLALNFNTLLQVFPEVLVFPGERVRLFASPSPGTLTADPQVLMARLTARRLEVHYVREYYLLVDLALPRLQYLASILHQQPVEINTDLNPRGYFYDLVLTGVREGLPLKDVLLALKRLPWFTPWIALGLAFFLFWLLTRGRPGLRYLTHVLVMGWGTMSLEVLMLVLYQIHLGYLYRQIGIVIAAFMLGLSAGGLLWVRLPLSPQSKSQWLVTLQLGLAALSLLLSGVLLLSQSTAWLPPDWLVQSGFVLVLALAGFAGGGIFSLSSDLWRLLRPASPTEGGLFYAVDLLGATLGTLGTSLLILPVWGILPTLGSVAALHALAALCLVGR